MSDYTLEASDGDALLAGLLAAGLAFEDENGEIYPAGSGDGFALRIYDERFAALRWFRTAEPPSVPDVDVHARMDNEPGFGGVSPKPEDTRLHRLRQAAEATVNRHHAETLHALTGNATVEERDTWGPKALAAEAFQGGTARPDQIEMLQAEATLTGETMEQLTQTILARSSAFHRIAGIAAGIRRKTLAALGEAADETEIQPILEAADAQAQAAVAEVLSE